MSWLTVALITLATYRLTRLLIEDKVIEVPRDWVLGQLDQEGKLHYLLTCYWCSGLWISLIVTAFFASTVLIWLITSLAVSVVVGVIAERV